MNDSVQKLLALARQQGVQAEVYFLQLDETPVKFETNRLKSLQTRATTGIALRVLSQGRLGFASSTDLSRLEALLAAAIETAGSGDPAEFDFLAAGELPEGRASRLFTVPSGDHFVRLGDELVARIRDYNGDILVSAAFTLRRSQVEIATTGGTTGRRERTTVSASLSGNLVRDADLLEVSDFAVERDGEPDYEQLVAGVIAKFRRAERTAWVESGTLPVVFSPMAAAFTLGGLFQTALSGQTVLQKTSPLADRLDQQVFSEELTLFEAPDQGTAATGFDDEGTPTRAKQFIERGVVQEFYWDRTWAARAGRLPGGNGFRSGLARPAPGLVNFCMAGGRATTAQLIGSIDEGILVEQVLGAGQSNTLAGEFSVNLDLGYKIEKGEIVGRLKNTMVAGNIFEAFSTQLLGLSRETSWVFGSTALPTIAFSHLGVSSRR
ncbi:TldD/PmbA family protein [Gloeobacter kilaueensis]|uniref:Peptidase U62 modulator of DNA gyrase n=1 Tax=Gloeobacter kilaueensis (strain ATCC BAA-2537 / CCAP 1431/1 / ULC 316 / JS1) TaxID=1183438 RepID=U5QHQ0_GLOK1|nr:TldD/PmbA family protein [Gloeobacter kilaueensis]AGY58393.1 peptidase U62 modulator of DNA gyrase [Gloeobacter kilaueensis JS1]